MDNRRVVSINKNGYSSAVHFLYSSMKSLVSYQINDQQQFFRSLTSFGTEKYDWVVSTKEMFNFSTVTTIR